MAEMVQVSAPAPDTPSPFPDAKSDTHDAQLSASARLHALMSSDLMDSDPEEAFDRITRLATRLLGVEVSLMSLVDERRQFFKSAEGLSGEAQEIRETPLSHSFCQYVVTSDKPLAVHDSRSHPLLKDNLATHEMGVIAYLGVPVHAPDGQPIGSLCAIHTEPRVWATADQQTMRDLVAIVENEMRLRAEDKRRVLLLEEMQHRVKNLFTVSGSLMRMTARDATDKDHLVELLQGRLHALSQAHDLALGDQQAFDETGPDLGALVRVALAPYRENGDASVKIGGPDVTITSTALTYLSLSIHELATNAAKYGALSTSSGSLSVAWTQDEDNLRIVWQETVELAEVNSAPGFGSNLLENAIVVGLGGAYSRDLSPTGLICTLDLPSVVVNSD